jgi:hypothetical protein
MGRGLSMHGTEEACIQGSGEKKNGSRQLARPRCIWDIIKMDLKRNREGGMNCNQWRAL